MTIPSNVKTSSQIASNFCGLLRKAELYVMFLGKCFSLKSSTRILSTSSQFVGRIWKIECSLGAGVVSLPFFSNPCFVYSRIIFFLFLNYHHYFLFLFFTPEVRAEHPCAMIKHNTNNTTITKHQISTTQSY